MALHASRLRLNLPDGSALDVRAPLPEDLFSVLINLPFFEEAAAAEPTLLLTPLPDEPLGGAEIEAELEED
jgi:hypothetical protein